MSETDPYQAYADETILSGSPLGLVVALYEGAIESSVMARKFLAERDIAARTKAINKINNILAELMRSLDDEKGGKISANLRGLYVYLQNRVIEAQFQQKAAPLEEVEKLLSTMLEGWKVAQATHSSSNLSPATNSSFNPMPNRQQAESHQEYGYSEASAPYAGGYLQEATSAYSL